MPETYETVRKAKIERHFRSDWGSDSKALDAALKSQYHDLIEETTRIAGEYAAEQKMSVDAFIGGPLADTVEVLSEIMYALDTSEVPLGKKDKSDWERIATERYQVWEHVRMPFGVDPKELPKINKLGLESAVGRYLDLPIRTQKIDRLLVDALVATEYFGFINSNV